MPLSEVDDEDGGGDRREILARRAGPRRRSAGSAPRRRPTRRRTRTIAPSAASRRPRYGRAYSSRRSSTFDVDAWHQRGLASNPSGDASNASATRRPRSCRAPALRHPAQARRGCARPTRTAPPDRPAAAAPIGTARCRPVDPLDRRDDVAHRRGPLGADVVGGRRAALLQPRERAHVRIRQVGDVNVVAQAGAVRRRVVLAEDVERRPAGRGLEGARDRRESRGRDPRRARRRDRRRRR